MAKVLKSKRGDTAIFEAADGCKYIFHAGKDHEACGGVELIQDEAHAKSLLEKYPTLLTEVPEKDWPEKYKKTLKDRAAAAIQAAKAAFPEIADQLGGKGKK